MIHTKNHSKMASNLQNHFPIFISMCLVFSLFASPSSCSSAEHFVDQYSFSSALGTWYGDPNGAGSGKLLCLKTINVCT